MQSVGLHAVDHASLSVPSIVVNALKTRRISCRLHQLPKRYSMRSLQPVKTEHDIAKINQNCMWLMMQHFYRATLC